jgi:hypothetical protein
MLQAARHLADCANQRTLPRLPREQLEPTKGSALRMEHEGALLACKPPLR